MAQSGGANSTATHAGASSTASGGKPVGSAGSTNANTGATRGDAGSSPSGGAEDAGTSQGGSDSGDAGAACGTDIGAVADARDFSMNTDTGQEDAHVLVMSKGNMIRRVLVYETSGDADHHHEFQFTDDELAKLLAGESLVVTTFGPPSNAAAGHAHTVTVRPCQP